MWTPTTKLALAIWNGNPYACGVKQAWELYDAVEEMLQNAADSLQYPTNNDIPFIGTHHVTLLYGFDVTEFDVLRAIVNKHFRKGPITLTVGEVFHGDFNPVILLRLIPSPELNALFWELYNTIGNKSHTLLKNCYDPHITIANGTKEVDISKIEKMFIDRNITLDTVFAYDGSENEIFCVNSSTKIFISIEYLWEDNGMLEHPRTIGCYTSKETQLKKLLE